MVFNFLLLRPKPTHVQFHFYFPFPNILDQIMHFCKFDYVVLMETSLFFFLSLIVAYSHAFKKNMPKTLVLGTFLQI
jgi:hypothetical protein